MNFVENYERGDITVRNGALVVDVTVKSGDFRNLQVTIDSDIPLMTVTAERLQYGISIQSGAFDPELLEEGSVEEYKPWPWSKTTKRRSKEGWVLFKETTPEKFVSNVFVLNTTP